VASPLSGVVEPATRRNHRFMAICADACGVPFALSLLPRRSPGACFADFSLIARSGQIGVSTISAKTNHAGGQSPGAQKKPVAASFRSVGDYTVAWRIRMTTLAVPYRGVDRSVAIGQRFHAFSAASSQACDGVADVTGVAYVACVGFRRRPHARRNTRSQRLQQGCRGRGFFP
jgi:hypothetical protein